MNTLIPNHEQYIVVDLGAEAAGEDKYVSRVESITTIANQGWARFSTPYVAQCLYDTKHAAMRAMWQVADDLGWCCKVRPWPEKTEEQRVWCVYVGGIYPWRGRVDNEEYAASFLQKEPIPLTREEAEEIAAETCYENPQILPYPLTDMQPCMCTNCDGTGVVWVSDKETMEDTT